MTTSLKLQIGILLDKTQYAIIVYERTCTQLFYSKEVGIFLLNELAKKFKFEKGDFEYLTKKIKYSSLQDKMTENDRRESRENAGSYSLAVVIGTMELPSITNIFKATKFIPIIAESEKSTL